MTITNQNLIEVQDLRVSFLTQYQPGPVVHDVNFTLQGGQTLAIVGESGAGKSVTGLSILRLLGLASAVSVSGKIIFEGRNLLSLSEREMRAVRGKEIAMVFQNSITSLNPFIKISAQLVEVIRFHLGLDKQAAYTHAVRMLEKVGIRDARARADSYPHEFSGGMRQRVMIALALSCQPKLLIADEPTSALDATTQYQILQLIRELQAQTGIAILLITHDLSLAAAISDHIVVMKAGSIVESERTDELLQRPSDPYTQSLLRAANGYMGNDGSEGTPHAKISSTELAQEPPLLSLRSLSVSFRRSGGRLLHALDGISLDVARGETLGLVGESGSGKTTIGRTILQLVRPSSGQALYDDGHPVDLVQLPARDMIKFRRRIQMIFQDPYGSLNPRMTIGQALSEPIRFFRLAQGPEIKSRVLDLMQMVELDHSMINNYPHQLSGGQRQRVSIARALAVQPELLVADEPIASLDVVTQLQILRLLSRVQREMRLTLLFISHDLRLVRNFCDRIAVLYRGRIVELAEADELHVHPLMPYSQALISATPQIGDINRRPPNATIPVDEIRTTSAPHCCCYYHHCPYAIEECSTTKPALQEITANHFAACIRISNDHPDIANV